MTALRQPAASGDRGIVALKLVDIRAGSQAPEAEPDARGGRQDMATDREYVDLKLEASEARAEVRFTELNGKLDQIIAIAASTRGEIDTLRTDVRNEYRSTRTTVVITGVSIFFALAALLLAVMTYGDAIFSRGMSVRDVVNAVAKEQADRAVARSQNDK